MHWWGPKAFTTPAAKIDLRPGGRYLNDMRSPEGQDFWSTGIFREIVEPERLVMTDSFADVKGEIVPASYYGMSEGFPLEMLITVTLEEYDGKTRLTMIHSGTGGISVEDRNNMRQGWIESFDKLSDYLKELGAGSMKDMKTRI
ncbi:MAG: SRPBCC domain-containing protein [Methanotrichaceae archaeon]|nr:SRPBCC domain-containing protein [Methanotrichaceae archaeon]